MLLITDIRAIRVWLFHETRKNGFPMQRLLSQAAIPVSSRPRMQPKEHRNGETESESRKPIRVFRRYGGAPSPTFRSRSSWEIVWMEIGLVPLAIASKTRYVERAD